MSDKVQIYAGMLATLVACAKDHIQDIETGIQEGLYDKADNADLETKKAALNTASLLVQVSPDDKKASEPAESPSGGYFIMCDDDTTADHCNTLSEARMRGQELCDAEPLPTTWTIQDVAGKVVEEIKRSDGKTLEGQIKDFPEKR